MPAPIPVYPTSSALEAAMVASLLPGPYDFRAYRCRSAGVATNKCPILPYRGVGRTGRVPRDREPSWMRSRARPGSSPTRCGCAISCGRSRCRSTMWWGDTSTAATTRNACAGRWRPSTSPACARGRSAASADGRLIGVGLSVFCEQGAHGTSVLAAWGRPVVPGYEQAIVRLTADGDLEIRVGTHSHGQGHETTFAQIAHEVLGIDFDRIKVLQGDTLYTPFSTATWGSRGMVMGGGAVGEACKELGQRAARIGAWLLQADPAEVRIEGGAVHARARQRHAQARWRAPGICSRSTCRRTSTRGGLEVTAGYRAERDSGTFSYATHAAVVAVDPGTGLVEILDYVVVEDGGVLVNPMIVDGQICGGTAQGIGTCLYEAMPFDAQGQPLASTMLDYMLPGATEVPDIRILHMETPSPYTEFGVKGIGEGGAVGPPAAIVSAVNDALRPLGVEVNRVPLTPELILDAIAARGGTGPRMKPAAFEIVRPASLAEAAALLLEHDGAAKVIAGGQSLGPMLNLRLAQPRLLVDITGIPGADAHRDAKPSTSRSAPASPPPTSRTAASAPRRCRCWPRSPRASPTAPCATAAPSAAACATPTRRPTG